MKFDEKEGIMMKYKHRIKLVLVMFFTIGILLVSSRVQAAGVNGTTIVLNARSWGKLYWVYK